MNTNEEIKEKEEDLLDTDGLLNAKQQLFCQLYTTETEFFGNGVQSYIEAYDVDQSKPNWYKTACASASRLLSNVKVIDRINNILEETGLNDAFIDKQLSFLITQHSDFGTKLRAIQEYNKLKQRIVDKKDITSGGKAITMIFDSAFNKHGITSQTEGDSSKSETL